MSHRKPARAAARTTPECEGCPIAPPPGRRTFLRHAALAVAGLVAAGASPARARALARRASRSARGSIRAPNEVAYPIPTADGAEIDREHELILVRYQGAIYAFALSCPHQKVALRWMGPEGRFQCPKHKSKYQPDGTFISGRATRGMDRHALRRDGDHVLVNLDVLWREDKNAAEWMQAVVRL